MNRTQNLLIRHAIGSRLFLDANRDGASFEIRSPEADQWTFVIHMNDEEAIRLIMEHQHELNLFVVEQENGIPVYKWWYYAQETPSITYDTKERMLFITVDTGMGYKT